MTMKRLACLALALLLPALLAGGDARAEDRVVAFCESWVSLRAQPSTSAERLAVVPLDDWVSSCEDVGGGWTRCVYDGMTGYILSEYLVVPELLDGPGELAEGTCILSTDAVEVYAQHSYAGAGETMAVWAANAQGDELWSRTFTVNELTELEAFRAFGGGAPGAPRAFVYQSLVGLMALDPMTGEILWTLPFDQVSLGASVSVAVAEDGTMYLGGYYGPDPVAVSADGAVLWQSDTGRDDVYWLYEITIDEDVLACRYEWCGNETDGRVLYDRATGALRAIEPGA